MSINYYCTKIKTIADLLSNMDKSVPDENLVAYTVNGFPHCWEGVSMNIRLQKPPPSWIETSAILLGEESCINSSRHNDSLNQDTSSSSTILYNGQSSGNRRNNRRNDRLQDTPPIRYGWVYIPPPNSSYAQQSQAYRPPQPKLKSQACLFCFWMWVVRTPTRPSVQAQQATKPIRCCPLCCCFLGPSHGPVCY